jgi:NitT/TauT family transport system substrate-binding protein
MIDVNLLANHQSYGGNAWFALAMERGYFAEEGINFSLIAGKGGYKAASLVLEGGVDLAFGDICGIVGTYAVHGERAPLGVYAIHQNSPAVIAVRADGPIQGPQDLLGKRLVGHAFDVGLRIFAAYVEASGINREAVEVVVSPASMLDMALQTLEGEWDGVFGYYASLTAALREHDAARVEDLRFLRFNAAAPDLSGSLVMASREALRDKPEAIRATLRAINRGLIATLADPDAAVAAALRQNPSAKLQIESARMMDTINGELGHSDLAWTGFGDFDPRRLQRAVILLADCQGLPRPPAASVFSADFLPPLSDRLADTAMARRRSTPSVDAAIRYDTTQEMGRNAPAGRAT